MNRLSRTRNAFARIRPLWRWHVLAPVLGGALAPKCLLCALAYVASGAALLGTRVELCGGTRETYPRLAPLAGAVLGASVAAWRHLRRLRASPRRDALD